MLYPLSYGGHKDLRGFYVPGCGLTTARLSAGDPVHCPRRCCLHCRRDMGVSLERDLDSFVTKPRADNLRILLGHQQERGQRMT
jgi:hypothetical protein